MNTVKLKKIAKITGISLGVVLIILSLITGALLLWLRGPHATGFVYNFAEKKLAEQGIYLKAGSVQGQIPFNIILADITVADQQGAWLSANELRLELNPFKLLYGTLGIDLVQLDAPVVLRLPQFNKANTTVNSTVTANEPALDLNTISLPVRISINEVALVNAKVKAEALTAATNSAAFAQGQNEKTVLINDLSVTLKAAAALESGIVNTAGATVNINLEVNGPLSNGTQGRLVTTTVKAEKDGLFTAPHINTAINASVHDEFVFTQLGLATANTNGCTTALFGPTELSIVTAAAFENGIVNFTAKSAANINSPHPYFSKTGLQANINTSGSFKNMHFSLNKLTLTGMGINFNGTGAISLQTLASTLAGDLQIAKNGGWYTVISSLADTTAIPHADFTGTITASMLPGNSAAAEHIATLQPLPEGAVLQHTSEPVALPNSAEATTVSNLHEAATLPEATALPETTALTNKGGESQHAGNSINIAGLRLNANLNIKAANFTWPADILYKGVGSFAAVKLNFSGPLLSPYRVEIANAQVGQQPQLSEDSAYIAKATGWFELALPGVAPLRTVAAASAEQQQQAIAMYAGISAQVTDFSGFMPEDSGFYGPAVAQATMFSLIGNNSFFDFTLDAQNADGEQILTPFENVQGFNLAATARMPLGHAFNMNGSFKLNAMLPKTGSVNANSDWFLKLQPNSPFIAGVKNLNAGAAGVEVAGNLQTSLNNAEQWPAEQPKFFSAAPSMPFFNGDLLLKIENWQNVNALFRRLELPVNVTKATPANVNIHLNSFGAYGSGKATQNAVLKLNLAEVFVALTEKTAPETTNAYPDGNAPVATLSEVNTGIPGADGAKVAVTATPGTSAHAGNAKVATPANSEQTTTGNSGFITNFSGNFDLTDLYSVPVLNANIQTGKGELLGADWRSFAVNLDFSGNTGRVNLAMREDDKAMLYVSEAENISPRLAEVQRLFKEGRVAIDLSNKQNAQQQAGNHIQPNELLVLQAGFTLNPFQAVLNRVVAHAPARNAGLYSRGPAYVRWGEQVELSGLNFGMLTGGQALCEAAFSSEKMFFNLNLTDVPLSTARIFTQAPMPEGTVNAVASLDSVNGKPSGNAKVNALLHPLRSQFDSSYDPTPVQFNLEAKLDENGSGKFEHINSSAKNNNIVRLHGSGLLSSQRSVASSKLDFNFDVPFAITPAGLVEPEYNAPLGANADWRGNIKDFWRLLPVPDRDLRGLALFTANVQGSLARLVYSLEAYLAGGEYEDKVIGLLVTDINAELSNTGDGLKLLLTAKDGHEGSAAFEAAVTGASMVRTGLENGESFKKLFKPQLNARGQINHFAPLRRDDVYMQFSGITDVSGSLFAPDIKADFTVERGDINVLAYPGASITTLPVEERTETEKIHTTDSSGTLDVKVNIPNRLFIRGMGLDSEWQGNIALFGPLNSPSFEGSVNPVRGYFSFLSRPFALSRGDINFWGGDSFDSSLSLQLTYSSANLVAYVNAAGSVTKPQLTLSSVPPMPQDQILSEVLFGKNIAQLTAAQALQVANGARELVGFGSGGFDLFASMRNLLGVDTLRIGSTGTAVQNHRVSGSPGADAFGLSSGGNVDDAAAPTVEAGKYINDSIYIGVEQGAVEDSTRVRVEIELKPNLTLQGSSSTKSSDVGIGWKKDY
ncbi:translocation/assembly module TamB domain-containing protein [Desulfovibrio sp. OttesenSCG-928-F07]|nr:translocation/assembly module TamB domain-containing protein [Desulfovibrio sp. OttesenSCG-928-F07]